MNNKSELPFSYNFFLINDGKNNIFSGCLLFVSVCVVEWFKRNMMLASFYFYFPLVTSVIATIVIIKSNV